MDGFHLDNRVLTERGVLNRKGAPDTFDAQGFLHLVSCLPHQSEIYFPVFDRGIDAAIAGAGYLKEDCETVIIEGNYLMFDAPIWRDLAPFWDLSIQLQVSKEVLFERLIKRWLDHGFSLQQAQAKVTGNDMKNAERVALATLPADITL